jgi:hypothetical protein
MAPPYWVAGCRSTTVEEKLWPTLVTRKKVRKHFGAKPHATLATREYFRENKKRNHL